MEDLDKDFNELRVQFSPLDLGAQELSRELFINLTAEECEQLLANVVNIATRSKLRSIYKGGIAQGDGHFLDARDRDMFAYMCAHDLPRRYGGTFKLPAGLRFLFKSKNQSEDTMIVRDCYERVIQLLDRQLSEQERGSGVIFSGAQGNGKSWCSLYVVWHFLRQNKCVVYEIAAEGTVYVIQPNGDARRFSGLANKATVAELCDDETVHVYDAKAKTVHEPAVSRAFLVEFSSRNQNSYAQTQRLPGILHCCIPSYELEELLDVCHLFDVEPEELRRRYIEIGPSIRYLLINNYDVSKVHTHNMAKRVPPEQLEAYMNDNYATTGCHDDISACLLKVRVDESRFPSDPLLAYRDDHVVWEFASRELRDLVIKNAGTEADRFIRNFITRVDERGITKLEGLAGNFVELVVDQFLLTGCFQTARQLTDDTKRGNIPLGPLQLWTDVLQLVAGDAASLSEALSRCRDLASLFCFCKSFPAVDYSAGDFRVVFQITVSPTHPVNLEALRAICRHVRANYPDNPTVKLVFVVPKGAVSVGAHGDWWRTQSFEYYEYADDAGAAEGERTRRKVTRKFDNLPEDAKTDLKHLEQWVVCYTGG